jgi:hypothetical protein
MRKSIELGWFSCGITSAVACKKRLEEVGPDNIEFYYIKIDTAHSDNERFINDCENWYGKKINIIRSKKYHDQFDVIYKERYINGPDGAKCTKVLKKDVRFALETHFVPNLFDNNQPTISHQTHGFEWDIDQITRAIDFKMDYPYTNPIFPLIEHKLTKENCAQILLDAGIALPVMYELGYNNNNCIGCVKGGKGYWNKIRVDFPEAFNRMANAERFIKHTCIKGVYLDELDPNDGRTPKPIIPSCSIVCEDIAPPELNLSKARQVYYLGKSIDDFF